MGSAKEGLMPGNCIPSLGLGFSTTEKTLQRVTFHDSYSAEPQTLLLIAPIPLEKGILSIFWTGLALGKPRTEFFKMQVKVTDTLGKQKSCVCLTVFQE